ncbi:MAG: tetratricopeptide repeat protein [Desulfobulbaceae bacterium]|nr:tetratricopeptide repeat protein [Desulfobulbaceae bacterium]
MIAIYQEPESGFQLHDALIFTDQLALEVAGLLPMPASVGFWFADPEFCFLSAVFSVAQREILIADRPDTTPFVRANMLIVPLLTKDQAQIDVVIQGVDASFLQKMASEWLLDFQKKVQKRFALIRQIYIDPGTGLYNRRALDLLLPGDSCWKSLFLIATVSRTHTIAADCQKVVQLASLLRVVTQDPIFYFGQGIFGCVGRQCDRRAALDFSRRLIMRLKREGLRRVHVGFSCLAGDTNPPEQTLHNCRQALLEAERRGPYSLCDAASLQDRTRHPLALPSKQVVQSLKSKWRGLDRFGLILVSSDEEERGEALDVSLLPVESYSVALSAEEYFVLLPGYSADQTIAEVDRLAGKIEQCKEIASCSIGFCHWPSVGRSKIDCVQNCRKALLHGSFYGDGAKVEFDALSLNVSGDFYFDEGDYKQAIREYRTGMQMKPEDINLLNSLGVALAAVNRNCEAIDCFSMVLEKDPVNYMALINKGMSCRQTGRDSEAVLCFEKGLQCREHAKEASLELYLQLVKLYCKSEKYKQAVTLLKQWQDTKGDPKEFTFFRLLGEACMGAGQNREAIHALQRSLQIHPENADSMSMLGLMYVLEEEGAEIGLSLCDRAIATDETRAEHYYRRAAALYALDRFADALTAVRAALQRKRNDDRAIMLRGRIYEKLGWMSRAKQSYQRIVNMKFAARGRKKQASVRLEQVSAP